MSCWASGGQPPGGAAVEESKISRKKQLKPNVPAGRVSVLTLTVEDRRETLMRRRLQRAVYRQGKLTTDVA
ncbi:MAG: hypothetical protein U0401_00560 [Anaerolineae bacterium]